MKVSNISKWVDARTFQPMIRMTVDIPMEAVIDASRSLDNSVIGEHLGNALLAAYEEYKDSQKE